MKLVRFLILAALLWALAVTGVAISGAYASDHLDSPTVIADPRTDIGDLFAWTSPDGRQLNLAMTIVGHTFSPDVAYGFHIDSGAGFGRTTATTDIVCRFASMTSADCRSSGGERLAGDASQPAGLASTSGRSRVYAGVRDDPFFNNVRGSRDAFRQAAQELATGTQRDAAGCPAFTADQSAAILDRWKHTDGGPARNFLAGWTPSVIVLAIDLSLVNRGGPVLAVWADAATSDGRVDRTGRPLTGNGLLAHLEADEVADELKLRYNAATPASAQVFAPVIAKSLALYDGYDGHCGNQLMISLKAPPAERYMPLARLLADDRLWVSSAARTCTQLFAVELASQAGGERFRNDCGGRAPSYDAANVYRSLLANGTNTSIDDGVHKDEEAPSDSVFPFLAAPAAAGRAYQ